MKRTFVINSPLSPAEASAALAAVTQPPSWHPFRKQQGAALWGTVSSNSFKVWRILSGRNSFQAIGEGRVEATGSGSRITVSCRLARPVVAFLLIWFTVVGLGAAVAVATALGGHTSTFEGITVPVGMLVLAGALCASGFWGDLPKLRELLAGILEEGQ